MNGYTELLNYIKKLGEGDSYINVITKGEDGDLDKMTVYPELNIVINNASFPSDATIGFTVELTCRSVRDVNKEVNIDKFYSNDNEVDNLNETMASLNRIWRIMHRDFGNNNITASDVPSLEAGIFKGKDILDGWTMTFDVEMPNIELDLCKAINEC